VDWTALGAGCERERGCNCERGHRQELKLAGGRYSLARDRAASLSCASRRRADNPRADLGPLFGLEAIA